MATNKYHYTPAEQRIRTAIGKMPAGVDPLMSEAARHVGLDASGRPCPITMEDLAAYLEACIEVHTEHYKGAAETLNKYRGLVADVEAMRRVLGVGGKS